MFQKMSDEPVKVCPECGSEVKRLIGKGAGTIFKGSGFYQTDYKNKPAAVSEKKSHEPDKTAKKTPDKAKKTEN